MGTNYYWTGPNYYWIGPETVKCECCGHEPERQHLHIGKSSGGWCFSLRTHKKPGAEDVERDLRQRPP